MTDAQLRLAKQLKAKVLARMAREDAAFLANEMMTSKIKINPTINIRIRSK